MLIVVAATFIADPIGSMLRLLLSTAGLDAIVSFAPYNQVNQQLLDSTSEISRNKEGVNILLVRLDSMETLPIGDGHQHCLSTAPTDNLIETIHARPNPTGAFLIIASCPPSSAVLKDPCKRSAWERSEARLIDGLGGAPGVILLRANDVLDGWAGGDCDYYDEYADRLADVPYKSPYFAALALRLARTVDACLTPRRKVIVVDCDDTLWSGSCGDDGPDAVVIDRPREYLQRFLKERKRDGMLLCLCSRNEEADVWNVFSKRREMILEQDDIVAWRINWATKPENIRELAHEIQLDVDTFIFIDDSPVECAQVEALLPEVVTVRLPDDPLAIPGVLEGNWAFDVVNVTDEDRMRTNQYQTSQQRKRIREQATTVDEFIGMLNVRVMIRPAKASQFRRIAQLTQRTSQYNCTLRRRSESELHELYRTNSHCILSVEASDRYGDYGLVGALIATCGQLKMVIDTFLLSCRVLGRNIESQMLREAETLARSRGCTEVHLPFVRGPRNMVAKAHLDTLKAPWIQTRCDGVLEYVLTL